MINQEGKVYNLGIERSYGRRLQTSRSPNPKMLRTPFFVFHKFSEATMEIDR